MPRDSSGASGSLASVVEAHVDGRRVVARRRGGGDDRAGPRVERHDGAELGAEGRLGDLLHGRHDRELARWRRGGDGPGAGRRSPACRRWRRSGRRSSTTRCRSARSARCRSPPPAGRRAPADRCGSRSPSAWRRRRWSSRRSRGSSPRLTRSCWARTRWFCGASRRLRAWKTWIQARLTMRATMRTAPTMNMRLMARFTRPSLRKLREAEPLGDAAGFDHQCCDATP